MLDTNIVSDFMRYPEGRVGQKLRMFRIGSVGISIIVLSELRFGVARVGSLSLSRQVEWALGFLDVVPLAPPVDDAYSALRAALERKGRVIGPNDMFIAAHALAFDLTLVTANVREFSRVPELRVENWLD